MSNNTNSKLYQSQGNLVQQCHVLAKAMDRDLSILKKFEITSERIAEFREKIQTYTSFENDAAYKHLVEAQVHVKNTAKAQLSRKVQYLLYRIRSLYGRGTPKYKSFGMHKYYRASGGDLLFKCNNLSLVLAAELPELARRDIHQSDLDDLNECIEAYKKSLIDVNDARQLREEAKDNRLAKGIELQAILIDFAEIGKIIWRYESPSKYKDYMFR